MTHQDWPGRRCRTLRNVLTAKGIVPRDTRGTLRYEINDLGRHLVFADWDNGMSVPVPPHEIAVLPLPEAKA
jgi:hypothetical protein